MTTTATNKKVFLVQDGENHWVVASDADEAISIIATQMGWDSVEDYLDEIDGRPQVDWAPLHEPIIIRLDENIPPRLFKEFPRGTKFKLTAEVMPAVAAEHMEGVICSTCYP